MKIPYPNAFTTNRLGAQAFPFPFGASSRRYDSGLVALSVYPQRVTDVSDLVEGFAGNTCVVFDVGHTWEDLETGELLSLEQIAEELGIDCLALDINVPALGEVIAVSKTDFGKLARDVPHRGFHMIDLPVEQDDEALADMYATLKSHYHHDITQLLDNLGDSNLYLDGHDDCFLYVEARDYEFLGSVLARTLQIFCGTLIFESRKLLPHISEVPGRLIDEILPLGSAMTVLRENSEFSENKVRIPFSSTEPDLEKERTYDAAGVLGYDLGKGKWSVSPP